MSSPEAMTTLSKVMRHLEKKGYGPEFKIYANGAGFHQEDTLRYNPDQLTIVKTYRFEGASDPADMGVLYAIEASDGRKGMLLNAYGTYSNEDEEYYDTFILEVPVSEREHL